MSNYYYHSLLLLLSFTVTHQILTGNTVSDLTWSHIVSTTTTLHPFNGLFSRTTWVSRYKIGKNSLDLNEARDDGVLGCSGISWTIYANNRHLAPDR